MKKLINWIIALSMLIALIPAQTAFAASGQDIVDYAYNTWQGTPWRSRGSVTYAPKVGIDCSYLVYDAYAHFGYSVGKNTTEQRYAGVAVDHSGLKYNHDYSNLKPSDIILFRSGGVDYGHVGIYAGNGEFIHAATSGVRKQVLYGDGYNWNQYTNEVRRIINAPEPHTHSWSYGNDSSHPHKQYRTCSCSAKEYTGSTQRVSSCRSCYPVGNVSLTRSYSRTSKDVTLYRNNVSNANEYTLILYRNGIQYGTYDMVSTSKNITGLASGTYYATLTAKNTNTGETRNALCDTFTLVDTYAVTYDANGGENAPSAQSKIKDEDMTITSSAPQRTGYIFKGWAPNKTATEPQYQSGGTYTKNTPITLYAVWEPEIYTISFDVNGGKGEVESTTITYGNTMKMPNTVIKEGSYLKGWSQTKGASTPDYKLGMDYMLTANMTLYAVWGQSTWGGTVASGFAGGNGTEENPYQISNAAELAHLADIINNQQSAPEYKYYILTDNINLGYEEWLPIGIYENENQYFYGSFEGNGYTISDLYISQANANYVGLFGHTKDSVINHLAIAGTISGVTINSDDSYIGAFAGYADNTEVSECSAEYANISNIATNGTSYIGSMFGYISGDITGCRANESYIGVKDGSYYAGIIAGCTDGNITDTTVKSSEELFSSTTATSSLHLGGITGQITGNLEKCTVSAGYLSSNIRTASATYVGGIVGYLNGKTNLCTTNFTVGKSISGEDYTSGIYATGSGNGGGHIGGLTGYMAKNAQITNCKYDGQSISQINSNGQSNVGGIVGSLYGKTQEKVSVAGGRPIDRSVLPTRRGYVATWYTDSNLKNEYNFSTTVSQDMTLYAKWDKGEETPIEIWDGTAEEPAYDASTKTYTITNGKELAWVAKVSNTSDITKIEGTNLPVDASFSGYTVELANDIYLNDITNWKNWSNNKPDNYWMPIAAGNWNCNKYFSGIFDGKNYTIYGVYNQHQGLIGYMDKGLIRNVNVSYSSSSGTSDAVGSLVGRVESGTVENCSSKNTICCGGQYIGGIVGYNNGVIYNCYNEGQSLGALHVGGIVGYNNGTIQSCYNSGKISFYMEPEYSWYTGSRFGGISGANYGTIECCYNLGDVYNSDENDVGGISGNNGSNANITLCYNVGTVYGKDDVGGIVGENAGMITNSYATQGTLYNNTGSNTYISSVSQKSSSAMKSLSNLSGFKSDIWAINSSINNGYPYLKVFDENYKTYTLTIVEDANNAASINKCFVKVDGAINGESQYNPRVGGIVGGAGGDSTVGASAASNLVVIANRINSTSTNSSIAYSGDMIGLQTSNALNFENVHAYSSMDISATNNVSNTSKQTSQIASTATLAQMKQLSFLKNVFGPDTYQSLDYLKENPDAVWVCKSGEFPELYYNVLRNVTVSDVENGTISVDKTQAVDDEIVTVNATPNEGYILNKIYVNGEEIDGATFVVDRDSDVYATFAEETAEYKISVAENANAAASLVNLDKPQTYNMSLFTADTSISAEDGEEIKVNTQATEDYTVDAIYVNGEEMASDSFIVTDDSVVTMDVKSINADIEATTYDAVNIVYNGATLGGSVEDIEGVSRYIRYWKADTPDEVYTTEVQEGGGEYSVTVTDLETYELYQYQMTESGEIKSFMPEYVPIDDSSINIPEPCFTVDIQDTYAEVTNTGEEQTVTVIIAEYDGEALKSVTVADITFAKDEKRTFMLGNGNYKVFVWNSLSGMVPMTK